MEDKLKAFERLLTIIDELREKYKSLPAVVSYLDAIQQDVIDNVDDFIKPPEPTLAALMGGAPSGDGKGTFAFSR